MKYIIAIIQPDRIDDVLDNLDEKGIALVTVTKVLGRGRQRGVSEIYRGHHEVGSLLRKLKLEIAVTEEFVEPALEAITSGARSEQIGDGKIFVLDLKDTIRIRTGETGDEAIG